jgi:hypothetical protein
MNHQNTELVRKKQKQSASRQFIVGRKRMVAKRIANHNHIGSKFPSNYKLPKQKGTYKENKMDFILSQERLQEIENSIDDTSGLLIKSSTLKAIIEEEVNRDRADED